MTETSNRLNFTRTDLSALAEKMLVFDPDPVPRYLILRDLLRRSPDEPGMQEAGQALSQSHWIRELENAQLPDGTWGRFHTQDTRIKTPFPTTEFAIRRALALGLDRRSPMLQKTMDFLSAHLRNEAEWSDPPEKHDHPGVFSTNIRSISAGMLALIDPDHPAIVPLWERWAEIVSAAFEGDSYDPDAELARHQVLTGIPSRRLFAFHAYYPLLILSATRRRLPIEIERKLLAYVFHRPEGIYYVYSKPLDEYPRIEEKGFIAWLHAQEILSRFALWKEIAPGILNWIWSQRSDTGLWELGQGAYRSFAFPLSESWRRAGSQGGGWFGQGVKPVE